MFQLLAEKIDLHILKINRVHEIILQAFLCTNIFAGTCYRMLINLFPIAWGCRWAFDRNRLQHETCGIWKRDWLASSTSILIWFVTQGCSDRGALRDDHVTSALFSFKYFICHGSLQKRSKIKLILLPIWWE